MAPVQSENNFNKSVYPDDLRLVSACLVYDDAAWQQLIALCRGICYSVARNYDLTNEFDDLFAAFIVKLLGSTSGKKGVLVQYNGSGSLRSFLVAVFRSLLLDYVKSPKFAFHKPTDSSHIDQYAADTELIAELTAQEDIVRLQHAVQSLPPAERRLIDLYYYNGLSTRRIAKIVNKSKSAISRQIISAINKLKSILETNE